MTTESTPPPPAGWYLSPDGSPRKAWWNGTEWDLAAQGPEPTGPTHVIERLATATQVLLGVSALVYLVTSVNEIVGIGAATSFLGGNTEAYKALTAYDQVTLVVSILTIVVLIATAVLWVVWQFQVAKRYTGRTQRSAGWHAGSWFIPFVSWWFPYQNVSDLWRAVGRARPSWQPLWWGLWIAGNIVLQISGRVYQSAQTLDLYLVAMVTGLIGDVLMLAAAPLAILLVRGITRGVVQGAQATLQGASVHSQP